MRRSIALLLIASLYLVGCNGNRRQAQGRPQRRPQQVADPFYSITYPRTTGGPVQGRTATPEGMFPTETSIGNIMGQNIPLPVQQTQTSQVQAQPMSQPRVVSPPVSEARLQPTIPVSTESLGPSQVTLIYPSPEYGVLKVDKVIPREVDLNVQFKYSLIITNLTNASLANLIISETLAPTFQFKGATPTPQQAANNQLIWRLEALGPKASERFEISGIPSRLDTLTHATNITYAMATASTIRVVQSTLELVRKVPMEALLGEPITAEYTVTNTGSGTAQDVRIVEQLPTGLTTTDGRNEIRIDVGQLRPGQARTFSVQLQATKPGTFTGQAKVLSSSNAQAQSAALPITVRRPVLAVRRLGPERVYLGRMVSYELHVDNQGDGVANDVVLEELVPAGVVDLQTAPVAMLSIDKLTWNLGTIPPKTGKVVRVSYRPTSAGVLTSTSTASARLVGSTTSTVRIAVVGIPTLRLDVIDLEDPIEVRGNVTYVITVSNEGSATDRNLQINCELDDSIEYISCSGPTQGSSTGRILNLGVLRTLGPGEKATWRVVTKALRAGPVRFKVSMTSESLSRPVEETEATFLYD